MVNGGGKITPEMISDDLLERTQKGLSEINFAPITIFYGGNGSGKTTLLNVIAEK